MASHWGERIEPPGYLDLFSAKIGIKGIVKVVFLDGKNDCAVLGHFTVYILALFAVLHNGSQYPLIECGRLQGFIGRKLRVRRRR